jgi:methionine-rich copper-binding protein CopC
MGPVPSNARFRGVATACGVLAAVALLLAHGGAWAHAFLNRSDPRAGATVGAPPARVRVWFDGPIEPVFSTIRVENRDRQRVDRGDGNVSPEDPSLLEVGLSPLPPGRYRVAWSVIARDGHRKDGDFAFRVQ